MIFFLSKYIRWTGVAFLLWSCGPAQPALEKESKPSVNGKNKIKISSDGNSVIQNDLRFFQDLRCGIKRRDLTVSKGFSRVASLETVDDSVIQGVDVLVFVEPIPISKVELYFVCESSQRNSTAPFGWVTYQTLNNLSHRSATLAALPLGRSADSNLFYISIFELLRMKKSPQSPSLEGETQVFIVEFGLVDPRFTRFEIKFQISGQL
jgi:hypothetical protein